MNIILCFQNFQKGVFIMANKTKSELFSSLLYIVIGILLVAFRLEALEWAMTIAGVLFVISGIFDLIKKNWAGGAVSLIIGISILVLGWTAAKIVLIVLGIMIAVKGLVSLLSVLASKNKNLLEIIFAILSIVLGVMLAFGNALEILIVITGILLAVDGVLGLIGSLLKK